MKTRGVRGRNRCVDGQPGRKSASDFTQRRADIQSSARAIVVRQHGRLEPTALIRWAHEAPREVPRASPLARTTLARRVRSMIWWD